MPLPSAAADLRALAWAASGAERFGQAQASLAITQPLTLRADAPSFLRQGDLVELAALIRNTSAVTQAVDLSLAGTGVALRDTPPTQQATIAPGAMARLAWMVQVEAADRAALELQPPVGQWPNAAPFSLSGRSCAAVAPTPAARRCRAAARVPRPAERPTRSTPPSCVLASLCACA